MGMLQSVLFREERTLLGDVLFKVARWCGHSPSRDTPDPLLVIPPFSARLLLTPTQTGMETDLHNVQC